ncbi:hydrogenase assembly chaperone HypC/HupF [Hahella chejuensis KCTC 2396]|uniref:Hydrogenase assembly chaperone HypC/HupF n=1 Tax=Hahella chejuensis (strain KCTC 2396) TaxID=349521 RepID=Q2SQS9_HAHCH|nr:HypC/HybG/HupF family hydrogenase formation chaperone [Hahella chejuensis]ABC26995.1 hydrogenase assembly chaperone HypC/HupF [Hahella chejuensis KCTC 2396]
MCLAIPVQVESLLDNDEALVDIGGLKKRISLALVDDVCVGDYVILHVGYALSKIDEDEALRTLELFDQMQALQEELGASLESDGSGD